MDIDLVLKKAVLMNQIKRCYTCGVGGCAFKSRYSIYWFCSIRCVASHLNMDYETDEEYESDETDEEYGSCPD